jgi:glycosyltransferase involved in cell wall biosynthesis
VKAAHFAIPGDLGAPTGGYAYARRILGAAASFGLDLRHVALPGGFPHPSPEELAATASLLRALPEGEPLLIDGLAYGAFDADCVASARGPVVALVHHPLGLETGLDAARAKALIASERAALAAAAHVVVTSPATAATLMERFGVDRDRLAVALPGTDRARRARGSAGGDPVHIVSVGSITPRKGHDALALALARLKRLPWRCTIAGDATRDPATAAALEALIAREGLARRIAFAGALATEALDALYDGADIFALATRYEGFGMVFTEAMARGLPIVATAGGATADTVPAAAGLVTPVDDVEALAASLERLIADPAERRRLSDAAWTRAQSLPSWEDAAGAVCHALNRVSP